MRRVLALLVFAPVAAAQEFTPDTSGLESVVGAVLSVALMLAVTAVVLGVIWFTVDVWMHRR
jgi:hypothetical protein